MSISYSSSDANAILDATYDTRLGASPVLEIRSGAPAGPDNAAGGTLGVSMALPASPFNAAAAKSKTKAGTWSGTGANAITAGHYRLKKSGGSAFEEGTVTATGGGGDATLDNTSIAVGQTVQMNTFTKTLP